MNPRYPVYVISKGRWESRLTAKALDQNGVPYHIVVEPQEYDDYAAVIDPEKILVLPFSNLGQGSIPARNWVWEHSIRQGAEWHWILDDNIRSFGYKINGRRRYVRTGTTFYVIEDFANRYENVAIAGMQYKMFVMEQNRQPPLYLNTRIYSCILLRNDLPYRWRGRYNEDTDLSIRALKDGWCTALFNAFWCDKQRTMTMKGGNTSSLYLLNNEDGRLLMARSLQLQHPDVVRVIRRWGRWQHLVNYAPFKGNRLRPKPGVVIPGGTDNYGLVLVANESSGVKTAARSDNS